MKDSLYPSPAETPLAHSFHFKKLRAFTLVEAMMAVSVSLLTLGAAMMLNGQQLKVVKNTRETNASSLLLEGRMEQFRILTWNNFTDSAYIRDQFIATRPPSAALLPNVSEQVKVSAWPDANASKPMVVEYSSNGTPTILLSGKDAADSSRNLTAQRMAKVELIVSWTGKDNQPRARSYASIMSNGGVSRVNLPAFGGPAGGTVTTTTTTTTTTGTTKGKGRGNAGGKSGTQ
jgi:hypothetical protein